MQPSAQVVALRLAVMLKRSGKTRGRVSETTLRRVSGRSLIREAFVLSLQGELADLGCALVRLSPPRGGFAIVAVSALEGAPPLLIKSNPLIKLQEPEALWKELDLDDEEVEEPD